MNIKNWGRFLQKNESSPSGVVAVSLVPSGLCLAHILFDSSGLPNLAQCAFYACAQESRGQKLVEWVSRLELCGQIGRLVLHPIDYRLLQINIPEVPPEEISQALHWRVQDLLDFPAEEAEIEYFPMPASQLPGRGGLSSVVACRKSLLHGYRELCKKAKLKLDVVDIPELALRNIAERLPESGQGLALLYLSQTRGMVQVQKKGTIFVSRMVDFGSQALAADFATRKSDDLSGLFGRLALEIQRSMDYYESYFGMNPIVCLQVCPIAEGTTELADRLHQALGLPTKVLDISSLIPCGTASDDATLQPCMPVIGLGLRGTFFG